ncbi:MAG: hypothetical protein ACK559_02675 [bacterium]
MIVTSETANMLTNEQIARLIVDAYNMGKTDGYQEGYSAGWDDATELEEEEEEEEEEEDDYM